MDTVDVAGVDELQNGEMLACAVAGERILIAKYEDNYFAIGAVCTHEEAYLDQGSLVECAVYCPRHFSSFDVRTGAVLGPPAERPVLSYPVTIKDGRILIGVQTGTNGETQTDEELLFETGDQAGERESRRSRFSPEWMLGWLDSRSWVATASTLISAAVMPAYRRVRPRWILDLLHGSRWLGHAVHPAASDLPIGFWSGGVVLYAFGNIHGARTLTIAGLCASAFAIITGLADWAVTDGRDKRMATVHGLLNVIATSMCAGSLVAYQVLGPALAFGLLTAGLAVTLGAAYL
jgi:nitrite reductase/ring-hydroxylating ferredoxin subunit